MPFRDHTTGAYPVSHDVVRRANPNVSFPVYFESAPGYDWVTPSAPPSYDSDTQYCVETPPVQQGDRWVQTWELRSFTPEELAARRESFLAALQEEITQQTQTRLDVFARSRGYDSILSACTYAASAVPKFAAEGRYCAAARDATWGALQTILADVLAGTRPVPTGFADIEPELPALLWPESEGLK